MMGLGDYAPGTVIYTNFTTVDSTGAPTVLTGTPAISVYKDDSTTQSTSGVTLTASFDSVTGLNNVKIDTSADGTFYAAGSDFSIVITAGTVGGVSVVGYVVGRFSLNKTSALRPTTAGRTLDVSSGGEAGLDWANIGSPTTTQNLSGTSTKALEPTTAGRTLDVTATGAAGVDWANVENQGTAVNLSATNIDVDQVVASVSGAVGSVTGSVTVGTNNDKTGYALSAAGVDAVWDEPLAAHTTADTPGNVLNMLTQDTVTLSSDVALGSIVGQLLDAGTSWTYDRTTDSLEAQRDNLGTNGAAVVLGSGALANVTAWTVAITGNITGNLSGSVGSVTGAVGSVTGNVGGNVSGTVASVVGNVGGNVVGSVASVTAPVTLTSAYDFAKGTVAMTESYAANGAAPTPVQALMAIHQSLGSYIVSGTSWTIRKLDGSTTAFVITMNSSTDVTAINRA